MLTEMKKKEKIHGNTYTENENNAEVNEEVVLHSIFIDCVNNSTPFSSNKNV